mgnify:FL=1|jgi:hypothetical protein
MKITKANLLRGACWGVIAFCFGSVGIHALYTRLTSEAKADTVSSQLEQTLAESEPQEATNPGFLALLSLLSQRPQQITLPSYDPVRASLEEGCPVSENNFYINLDKLLTNLDMVDGYRTPTGVTTSLVKSWSGMLHSYSVLHNAPHDVETQPWVSVCTDPLSQMEKEIKGILTQARTYKGTENEPLYFELQVGIAGSAVANYEEFSGLVDYSYIENKLQMSVIK